MADKKDIEIGFKTVAKGDGAEKTEKAIKRIGDYAKTAVGQFKALANAIAHPATAMGKLVGSLKSAKRLAAESSAEMKKNGEGLHALAALLRGNFDGVGAAIMSAMEKTKRWQAGTKVLGAGKMAGVAGIVTEGIKGYIKFFTDWFNQVRQDEKDFFKEQINGLRGAADALMAGLDAADAAAARRARRRESERNLGLAYAEERRTSGLTFDRLSTDQALLGTRDPAERERLNREYARKAEDAGYSAELERLDAERADSEERTRDTIEKRNRLKAARAKIAAMSKEVAAIEANLPDDPGLLRQIAMRKADEAGISDFAADRLSRIESVQQLQETMNGLMSELGQQIKEADTAVAEAQSRDGEFTYRRTQILNKRDEAQSARRVEDEERQREYEMQNAERAREISERTRRENEDQAQADIDYEMSKMSHAEKMAALTKRRMEREQELARVEAELAELEGIREENLSKEQRQRRSWLEQDRARLLGQTRADANAVRDMERQGDTESYGRYRQYQQELIGENEADYQMLRQWRERRLGAAGRESGARSELDRQQGRLAEAQTQLDFFVKQIRDSNGGVFNYDSMTAEQKAMFNDLRSDVVARRGDVRSAQGAYMDAMQGRAAKDVEFRNGLAESNRLVALGLAGGGEFQWGMDTAKNTGEMARILKEISDKVGNGRINTESATYGF